MPLAQTTFQVTVEESSKIGSGVEHVVFSEPGRVEFLIVLIGVIVGLSIGKLFGFVGDFLVHRRNAKAAVTHGLFLLALFVYQVYYWWDIWELKELAALQSDSLSFWTFFRLLLIPMCLYCATALLCPMMEYPKGDEKLSMADHFNEHCRPIYFLWFILCLIGAYQAHEIREESWSSPAIYIRGLAAGLFLLGYLVRRPWMNYILAFVMLGILAAYITVPHWQKFLPGAGASP